MLVLLVAAASACVAPGLPDRQAASLSNFRAQSRAPVRVKFDEARLRFATFDVAVAPGTSMSPAARAMLFLEQYASLYSLEAPRESLFVSRSVSNRSGQHVFFDQHFGDVSVYGAQLAVHLDGDRVQATNGSYLTGRPAASAPRITAERAVVAAIRHAGVPSRLAGTPRLTYFNRRIFQSAAQIRARQHDGATHLAWQLTVLGENGDSGWFYVVDAASGQVLARSSTDLQHAPTKDIWIASAENFGGKAFCGLAVHKDLFTATGPFPGVVPDPQEASANTFTHGFYNFLFGSFHWHSWNGADSQIRVVLKHAARIRNASYSKVCGRVEFGSGMATNDIMAHELFHGVVDAHGGMHGTDEPGALNESLSDVFAALIDTTDWTIGEGSSAASVFFPITGFIRSLANPPSSSAEVNLDCPPGPSSQGCISPNNPITVSHPDRMSQYVFTSDNAGGIHINNGIPNKAAFLIAAGGTHNGITVVGIGRPKLGLLYDDVVNTFLTHSSDFDTFAASTILDAQAAAKTGALGFTSADACVVVNAFAAVELADRDVDCDGIADKSDALVDSDADGIGDAVDTCVSVSNPSQSDFDHDGTGDACDSEADGDGVPNASDNCPTKSNPAVGGVQADLDHDGVGDACDDTDFDGVLDDADNCPHKKNLDQANFDGDAFGDACDRDADNDGYCLPLGLATGTPAGGCPAGSDNCYLVPNPTQVDTDHDSYGDACDVCPKDVNTGSDLDTDGIDNACDPDDDDDGVADASDNCPNIKNPLQTDWNGNGIGGACDSTEKLLTGEPHEFSGILERRLERLQIVDLPIEPRPGDPFGCDWSGGDRTIEISVDLGVPAAAAIVDHQGRYAATASTTRRPNLRFTPRADFCAPAVIANGQSAAARSAFSGRSYVLRIFPAEASRPGQPLRVGVKAVPKP